MSRANHVYECVEGFMCSAFSTYGRFVARHPWKVLVLSVVVNGLLGLGMIRLNINIDAEHVYLPQGSQAKMDQDLIKNTFPDLSGRNYQSLHDIYFDSFWARVIVRSKSGNLLSRTELEALRQLNSLIHSINITSENGSTVEYSDLCARAYGSCAVDGALFWSPEFLTAVDAGIVTYPAFVSQVFGPIYYALQVGGSLEYDASGFLTEVEYIHLSYRLRSDTNQKDLIAKWTDTFKNRLSSYSSDVLDIAFGHFTSMDEELHRNVLGDIFWFAVTIFLMVTYACIATLSFRDAVSQRCMLGIAGILAASLAIVSGFGFCSAIGVDFVSIVGAVPFLVVGIGIDDMFILLSGLSGAQGIDSIEDKMAETLRASGVSITITTLTDFIAFMAGLGSSFIAVRNFCLYTGVSVVFCYINNVTFFAACLTLNERRLKQNRHFLTCRRIATGAETLDSKDKSKCFAVCCVGSPPKNRAEAESLLDKFPRWLFPKIVLKLPFKILIVILFLGYLAVGIYGCINLKQGLVFTQLVPTDGYFYKYTNWLEIHFSRQTPVSFVANKAYNYSDSSTKTLIDHLINSTTSHDYFDERFELNWLNMYLSSSYHDVSNETNFISGLRTFFNDIRYARFENDVVIDSSGTQIVASRFYVLSRPLKDSQEEGKMMLKAREIAEDAELSCFAFSPYFDVFEQYVSVLKQTMQSVGIALAAVFVVTCILMPQPLLIIFVTVAVAMIMSGVFGYMLYIDVSLSAITMVQLIMCIGFSVDFTAHICHGYITSKSENRDERVRLAIDKTGAPIFHGAVSSLVGVVVLFGANSYIFRTFAAVMSFVLLFGIAHALLLLLVVLSWIGPKQVVEEHPLSNPNSVNHEVYELVSQI
ncbi:patched domain-containing protein 3-like [Mya arenaria]|uniref:patched domain-containing protein 3-like n=1 Tax=Mya arenaria TaxID=6604 RepID=UPI0022E76FBE|nr:patched domain-containing protein 3-like [Mya arenaria]